MTIHHRNGCGMQSILLSRNENSMRIAVHGSDDVVNLNYICGMWVTEDCEPVRVDFGWTKKENPVVELDDCICSKELAAQLLHLLFSGDEAPRAEALAPPIPDNTPTYHQVV